MPKRKTPELKPEEQFKRFVDAAREHGIDKSGDELGDIFKRISSTKPKPSPNPGKGR